MLDHLPLSRKQIDYVVNSTAPINVSSGAIRSGKTVSSLLRWMMYVANAPRGGQLVMIGKTAHTIARNCFATMQDPEIFGPMAREMHYSAGAPTATMFGRTVYIVGANDAKAETKIRGFTCSGAYVDEVSLIPREFWNQLLGRMSIEGAQLFGTTNPDNPAHWLRRDVLNGQNQDVRSWKFVLDDNPKLSQEKKDFWKRQYTGLFYRRFILGEWVAAEGAIYDMFDEERHVVDELPPMQRWLGLGVDYGTSNPLSALLGGIGLDRKVYLAAEYRYDGRAQRRQLTDPEYSERIRTWLRQPLPTLHDIEVPWTVIDPSAASFRAQCLRDGLRPWPAENAVMDGIRTVSGMFAKDQLRIHRSCTGLIDELPGYSWDDDAALKGEDKPVKVADHSCDGARYLLHTTQKTWRQYVPDAA